MNMADWIRETEIVVDKRMRRAPSWPNLVQDSYKNRTLAASSVTFGLNRTSLLLGRPTSNLFVSFVGFYLTNSRYLSTYLECLDITFSATHNGKTFSPRLTLISRISPDLFASFLAPHKERIFEKLCELSGMGDTWLPAGGGCWGLCSKQAQLRASAIAPCLKTQM